ncbi:MAG: hypothetical protein LBI81_00365 [Puniceicoccales bacterium]|nr:hypothetical protein [Puniceicoccales bacterium]
MKKEYIFVSRNELSQRSIKMNLISNKFEEAVKKIKSFPSWEDINQLPKLNNRMFPDLMECVLDDYTKIQDQVLKSLGLELGK